MKWKDMGRQRDQQGQRKKESGWRGCKLEGLKGPEVAGRRARGPQGTELESWHTRGALRSPLTTLTPSSGPSPPW